MKKNTPRNIIAFAFIAWAFLYPGTTKSQDLPEAQRLERCQNNKNRIVELEEHLNILNKDIYALMSNKEMEDTRAQLAFVQTMYDREITKDYIKYHRLSAQYNFTNDDCYDAEITDRYSAMYKCYAELERRINEKIRKAQSLESKRPQLITRKNEIDKQLAEHRNNLIALRCNESNVTSTKGACKLASTWSQTTEGIGTTTWTITSDGIATEAGKGYAKGKAKFDGTTLSIEWQTTNGYSGTYQWKLDSNCNSDDGKLIFKTPITSEHKSTLKWIK